MEGGVGEVEMTSNINGRPGEEEGNGNGDDGDEAEQLIVGRA